MRSIAFAALLLAAPAAAHASPESKAPPAKESAAKAAPNFEQMLGVIDKLFPPQPDPDPARLALARTTVQAMWPNGAYGKMMTGFMGNMFDRMMQLKASDFAGMGGKAPKATAAKDKDVSVKEAIAGEDPYFDQRMAAMRGIVDEEAGKISAIIDPRMREGLARAMARRFDAQQLGDINAFFATPSGHALASQYMQLWIDPDTIRSIFGSVPEMMKLMPEMMQKFKAANDQFPEPPAKAKPAKE
jgi:hypothetical protein